MEEVKFATIEKALESLRQGKFVVVMDNPNRENEGDLIMAAEFVTEQHMTFALNHGTGVYCVTITEERQKQLNLPYMVEKNTDKNQTAFTVSVDSDLCSTGVSSWDRAATIKQVATDTRPNAGELLKRPGHCYPLVARPGGVLQRDGHTEASVDLCKLAGLNPSGFIVELQDHATGKMMRLPECAAFAEKNGLDLITIEDMIAYRKGLGHTYVPEKPVTRVSLEAECMLPIIKNREDLGEYKMQIYTSTSDKGEHVVLIKGDLDTSQPILVRVHSECFTGDVLGSQRCDCGDQLYLAMKQINDVGSGVIIYNREHEGRGIGLIAKIKAYKLQQTENMDTYQANKALGFADDMRTYETAIAILGELGISKVDLMTDNKTKAEHFRHLLNGIVVLKSPQNEHNSSYLKSKQEKTSIVSGNSHKTPFNLLDITQSSNVNNTDIRVAIVKAAWNFDLIETFTGNIIQHLNNSGVTHIETHQVPGAFELPYVAKQLAKSGRFDVVVCAGILFKGETFHFEMASNSTAHGLMDVQLTTDTPVVNAVLNCITEEHAIERVTPEHTRSLAATAIHQAKLKKQLVQ